MINFAKQFSKNKAAHKSKLIEKFENRILTLDRRLLEATDSDQINKIQADIKKSEEFLMFEHEEKVKSAMFRSKAQFYSEGQKNSKYFFNLEKSRSRAKTLTALKLESGEILSNPKNILKEEKNFL